MSEMALPAKSVSNEDIALMQRVFSAAAANPLLLPEDFMAYIVDYVQTNRLTIPVGQITGFTQFTAQSASVFTSESTSSDTYTDLATLGPTLQGLSNGYYVVFVTCLVSTSTAGTGGAMTSSVNGDGGSDTRAADVQLNSAAGSANVVNGVGIGLVTLASGNNNIIQAKYARRNGGGGGSVAFNNRNLIALKYANL